MAIFKISANQLEPVAETSFSAEKIMERRDLQRLLRSQIEIISPNTLVIAEELGEFEGVRRRIDLLGVDKEANLVVIELKRTEDGGHMELQAIRYAAMVSAMTFGKAVDIYNKYLEFLNEESDAEESLLGFLGWDEPSEDEFCQDVKIVLASAEFSKELTASVLWLNERDLNINCYRLKPYKLGNDVLLDVQKIIPLPETAEFQVQIREKKLKERASKEGAKDLTKYDVVISGKSHSSLAKRRAILIIVKRLCEVSTTPEEINEVIHWKANGLWRSVDGKVNSEVFRENALKAVKEGGPAFDARRWFCNDEELIYSNDKTYAFTKMWGTRTEEAMVDLINKFPDHDIEFTAIKD